jgi:hypothetical protein
VACHRVAAVWVVWISKSNCSENNDKKDPAAMPGLLRQTFTFNPSFAHE